MIATDRTAAIAATPARNTNWLAHTAHRSRKRPDDLCPLCARYGVEARPDRAREAALGSDDW